MRLDVVPNARALSVLALREAGREVSEADRSPNKEPYPTTAA